MITINLLPVREERRRAGVVQLLALMGASLAVSLAVVALMHWSVKSDIEQSVRLAAQTQKQVDQFGPQLKQVEEYRTVKTDIERKLDVIERLSDARSGPVHVFDELAAQIPERVWLNKIDILDGQITVQGMSLDNELVALFLTGLEDSSYFKNVELLKTEAKTTDGFKLNAFEVTALLTSPAAELRQLERGSASLAGEKL